MIKILIEKLSNFLAEKVRLGCHLDYKEIYKLSRHTSINQEKSRYSIASSFKILSKKFVCSANAYKTIANYLILYLLKSVKIF